jgi:uncharacterized membrane protein YraQ (UPF0718 family)
MISKILYVLNEVLKAEIHYIKFDWYILLFGILLSTSIKVYMNKDKVKGFLEKNTKYAIPSSVLFGALTPLCACGTTAIVIAMFVTALPWGAVMAFLVSSPLTSPSEYIFECSFFGVKLATGVLISSIILGLSAGYIANYLDKKTSFFKGQFRLDEERSGCCSKEKKILCCTAKNKKKISCCVSKKEEFKKQSFYKKYKLDEFIKVFYNVGIKKVLFLFIVFIAIGKVIELALPKHLVTLLFGSNHPYSVILAATLGLPFYISGSASLPILKAFVDSGASQPAVLAFLIAGKATGVPVITGMSIFLKKKALAYYVACIYIGAILAGYIYQLFM